MYKSNIMPLEQGERFIEELKQRGIADNITLVFNESKRTVTVIYYED